MVNKNFAIIDVETTGASSRFGRIIEIGILRVEKGEIVNTFETLLNPGMEIPAFITQLTGIQSQDLVSAPTFDDVKDEVMELLRDATFVAHNVSFDYGFLKQEFRRVDYVYNSERMCTVKLSRSLFPEYKRHNLTELINRFEFECKRRHRALDDAKVLWEFMQLAENKFSKKDLYTAMTKSVTRSRARKAVTMKADDPLLNYVPVFD